MKLITYLCCGLLLLAGHPADAQLLAPNSTFDLRISHPFNTTTTITVRSDGVPRTSVLNGPNHTVQVTATETLGTFGTSTINISIIKTPISPGGVPGIFDDLGTPPSWVDIFYIELGTPSQPMVFNHPVKLTSAVFSYSSGTVDTLPGSLTTDPWNGVYNIIGFGFYPWWPVNGVIITLTIKPVDGIYIYVPIHGQTQEGFTPGLAIPTPSWITNSMSGLSSATQAIPQQRTEHGAIVVKQVPGLWLEGTRLGAPEILASRFAYVDSVIGGADPGAQAAYEQMGHDLEAQGRAAASMASRAAANGIASSVRSVVNAARGQYQLPVFIDLVGHSRGGSIAAEVLRELQSLSTNTQPVFFSLTMLDAIDPSGGSPFQFYALAGDLLNDPVIGSDWPNGRITNYYAEHGAVGTFPATWDNFVGHALGALSDSALVSIGYPHGRDRALPVAGRSLMWPGTTHLSIANSFASTASGPSASAFSLGFSTRIGELLANPNQPIQPLLTPRCTGCPFGPRSAPPAEYVTDPSFTLASASVSSVQAALSHPSIAAALTPDLEPIPTILHGIANSSWIGDAAWQRTVGIASFGSTGAIVPPSETIAQNLDPASKAQNKVHLRVRGTMDGGGTASVGLTGDGFAFSVPISPGTGGVFSIDRILQRATSPVTGTLDRISVSGGTVRLSLVSVGPGCPADFDGNNLLQIQDVFAYLSAWFSLDARADFNGIGGVTVQDIFDFLSAWFAGC